MILGIVASSQSILTVTGGTLYSSGGYNYRVFTSNGTLGIADGNAVMDFLIIAGGGGAGDGAGGAGGVITYSSQTLTPNNYAITVGSGGAGGVNGTTDATAGINSSIAGFTAAVGGGCGQVPSRANVSLAGGSRDLCSCRCSPSILTEV